MSWLDKQVSLYSSHSDNIGRAATYREILLSAFAEDLETIIELRKLDRSGEHYKQNKIDLKALLQCYTPAGLLETKKKGIVKEVNRTGIMQLDFDHNDIYEYDIEELKRCVFDLPFIGFCGLSCSGDGFYALALIAEPERLSDYAEHCFMVLERHGIKADQSKGKKVENLRYLSYDSNMLIRDNPESLHIKRFQTKRAPKRTVNNNYPVQNYNGNEGLLRSCLNKIKYAQTGQRWATVQNVSYTLGGLGDPALIYAIKSEIESNPEFAGEEAKYCKCAEDCFKDGTMKPLTPIRS